MRPELLKFSGLRSYHGTAEIDFTDLGLFAIIGDTGSGKSTIIEALGLALYARPTWSGQIEGLVSDGATAWQVELTFAAGGRRWRVTRRRGRGASIDKLEELDGSGEKVDSKTAVNNRVVEIIGLDHAQFTSAVVLPQGRFEKLLTAGETDRTKLLTSILGLDDIEATQQHAKGLLDEWAPKEEMWAALRDQFGPDPAAEAESAAARAAETEVRSAALAAAAQRCLELEPQLIETVAAHSALSGRLEAIDDLPEDFAPALAAAQQRWADADAAMAAADNELAGVREQVAQFEAAHTQALGGFATRDALVESLSAARRLADQLPGRLAEVDLARQRHAAIELDPSLGSLDEALIAAVERAADQVTMAEQKLRAAEQAQRDGTDTWRSLTERRARLSALEAQLPAATASLDAARQAVETAQVEVISAEQAETDAVAAARAALIASAADQAGAGCGPGDDCPVCSRPLPQDYTPPEHHADVTAAQAAEDSARDRVSRARDQLGELTGALERAAADVERLHTDIAEAKQAEQVATTSAVDAGVDHSASDDEAALAQLTAAVTAAEQGLADAREAAAEAAGAREAAQAELDRAQHEHQARLDAASGEVLRAERAVSELTEELDELNVPAGEGLGPTERADAVLSHLNRTLARLDEIGGQVQSLAAAQEEAIDRRTAADGRGRGARDDAKDLLAQLRSQCDAVAKLHGAAASAAPDLHLSPPPAQPPEVSSSGDLAQIAAGTSALLDEIDGAIAGAREALAAAARHRAGLEEELASLLSGAGVESSAQLHNAAGAARTAASEAGEALERQRDAAARAAALDERLVVIRPFIANLRVLQEALRNNRFVAHLVAARESELLAEASKRLLEITGGRFGFGAGFKVINRFSGEQRRSEALSGGERFQAALALALGLMEIASRGSRGRLEAVFIDEGFGSLDGAALEQALDRLRSVSGDGTTVALVSHLRAVAEHVNDVLHVTRDDTSGSRVTKLDAEQLERMLDDDARSGLTA